MTTTPAIPASELVQVIPGVISAGGTALDANVLILTANTRIPIGTVKSFATDTDVANFFGPSAPEAAMATDYFGGYDGSFAKPAAMLFTQYPWTATVPAYLRGGNISNLTLTQLQALSGVLIVTIDGVVATSSAINLSAATGFSNAAGIIQTALAAKDAVVTGSIATTTMTVTAVASGALAVGQSVSGAGVTAGTVIAALGSGTGGTGTYTVSPSQTASSTTLTAGAALVTYDSVSGAFVVTSGMASGASSIGFGSGSIAASLLLTSATGAVVSQGADIATPDAFMDAVARQTQDWASFLTAFEPVTDDCLAFAAWASGTTNRFAYICWDTDASPTTSNPATGSLGYLINQAAYSGTILIWEPTDLNHAVLMAGFIASIDFEQTNGRATMAYRSQAGVTVAVTDSQVAANLLANGYNFYGSYSTANDNFNFFQNGQISGKFAWIDSYINEIWLNNQLQLALLVLETQVPNIPYNRAGYGLIEAACNDPILAAVNFGAIRAGVTLSSAQVAAVNNAAGANIAGTLQTRGWFLQVKDASPQVRIARGSPPITLWYTDGQSVQKITLNSIEVQ